MSNRYLLSPQIALHHEHRRPAFRPGATWASQLPRLPRALPRLTNVSGSAPRHLLERPQSDYIPGFPSQCNAMRRRQVPWSIQADFVGLGGPLKQPAGGVYRAPSPRIPGSAPRW